MKRAASHPSFSVLPELIVFDLDDCLWTPEMYTLSEIPTKKVLGPLPNCGEEGVVAVVSGKSRVQLFPGALKTLQDIYSRVYPGVRIAAASSADTPLAVSIGKKSMSMLEIFPNVTMRDVFAMGWDDGFEGNIQIGRTHPLSSDKSKTHFPILHRETGIAYDKMVFFDDCNWGDHCSNVAAACPGVITQKTPTGLQEIEFFQALSMYDAKYSETAVESLKTKIN